MTSIGETLRRERLRQGLDLQQVSQSTKIGTRMLQAMEAGDFSKLPGGVFTRSFIRQYALALGMDAAVFEPELKSLHVEGDESTRSDSRRQNIPADHGLSFGNLADRGPDSNSLVASAVWVVLALLVCGGVYYIMNRDPAPATSAASPKPKPPEPAPDKTPDTPATASVQPPAPVPTPETEPAPSAASSGPVQMVLSANEAAWVSITADGKSAYVGVLQPNEKKEISANEKIKVVAGNAGGVDISLNGKPVDPIGPKGQVRVVELTQAGVHVIPRTPPNPAPLL